MEQNVLIKKLGVKPGQKLLVMNPPPDYIKKLGELPEGTEISTAPEGAFDFVQLFVRKKADIEEQASIAIQALKLGGLLWFAYPKKSSGVKTDITRDIGWEAVRSTGMRPVSLVSIDDTWSALRFRPESDVKARKRT